MVEGCDGYRLLCQIDEIFHSLNTELTAAVVHPEQLSYPLDLGKKPKPVLCCTARVDRESIDASLKGSTGEMSATL